MLRRVSRTPRCRDRDMLVLIRHMGSMPRVELCMDDVIMYILAHRKHLEQWALAVVTSDCKDFDGFRAGLLLLLERMCCAPSCFRTGIVLVKGVLGCCK